MLLLTRLMKFKTKKGEFFHLKNTKQNVRLVTCNKAWAGSTRGLIKSWIEAPPGKSKPKMHRESKFRNLICATDAHSTEKDSFLRPKNNSNVCVYTSTGKAFSFWGMKKKSTSVTHVQKVQKFVWFFWKIRKISSSSSLDAYKLQFSFPYSCRVRKSFDKTIPCETESFVN